MRNNWNDRGTYYKPRYYNNYNNRGGGRGGNQMNRGFRGGGWQNRPYNRNYRNNNNNNNNSMWTYRANNNNGGGGSRQYNRRRDDRSYSKNRSRSKSYNSGVGSNWSENQGDNTMRKVNEEKDKINKFLDNESEQNNKGVENGGSMLRGANQDKVSDNEGNDIFV